MNSKQKGKRGELELAAWLREHGVNARRGQQYAGGTDSPDIVHSLPGIHIECKRVEAGSPYLGLDQAAKDAKAHETPVVFRRQSHKKWIVIIDAEEFLALARYRN